MIAPDKKPVLDIDIDGNAFGVMGAVTKALRKAGADKEYIAKYMKEATSGDYDNLLRVTMNYVELE